MNIKRYLEQDKKLTIKVIAGVVLIAVAFTFYMIKEISRDRDADIMVISGKDTVNEETGVNEEDQTEGLPAEAESVMIIVDVAGAVVNPSVVELPAGSRVFEAIDLAGGASEEADTSLINRAEVLSDGQKIYIPAKSEMEAYQNGSSTVDLSNAPGLDQTNNVPGMRPPKMININTADSAALQQLSGIGPATAEKIIEYRNRNGKFKSIEEIMDVSGIGEKTFEKFKEKITV